VIISWNGTLSINPGNRSKQEQKASATTKLHHPTHPASAWTELVQPVRFHLKKELLAGTINMELLVVWI
jgi:hypothetical protein